MIKCNRCGNVNTAGAMRCQSCGNALSSIDTSGSSSKVMSQDQSALPAWLESLRVGERAPRPASNVPQFSPADLIEEGSLPSWMHAQRSEAQDVTGANLPAPLRSSALPAPGTDGTSFPATSFAANSLIDEQSLPSWMQEAQASTSLAAENGIVAENQVWMQEAQVSKPLSQDSRISAEDLVDKDNVPDWMKSLQQQSGSSSLGQPRQSTSTEATAKKVEPASPSPALSSGFAARDLVDQQSLPAWLTQLGKQDPTISASRDQLMQSTVVNEQSQPILPGQQGFAARDLIDQESLPSWMVQRNGQNALTTNSEQAMQHGQPGGGLPASSLLDMNALPAWLAQNGQAQTASPAYSQSPSLTVSPPNQAWPAQQSTAQGSPADFSSGAGGRLAASSIIDVNALPEWLKASGDQQSASQTSPQPYSAPYAGPPRVENVRVPSRPRSEVSSSETSEMAASVFASMLGVASTAPNFPPPTGAAYQQPGQPSQIEQMTLSGVSGLASMPSQIGMSMAGMDNRGGAQSMAGIPGGSGIYSMPGGPGAQSMAGIPGGSGIYSMPGGPGAQSMAGIPGGPGVQSMVGIAGGPGAQSMVGNAYNRNPTGVPTGPNAPGTTAGEEKNMKKRGLFGALLDWLSR